MLEDSRVSFEAFWKPMRELFDVTAVVVVLALAAMSSTCCKKESSKSSSPKPNSSSDMATDQP